MAMDISEPASNAKEAVHGRISDTLRRIKTERCRYEYRTYRYFPLTFISKRDMDKGITLEKEAQELIDHMTKRSFVWLKFGRIPAYNQLFSGDPMGNT